MAFGKKKKKGKKGQQQQPVYQPSGVKVDISNNPFYPPKKESDAKELGITAAVVVVCFVLVTVIVKNFNYYAIQEREQAKAYEDYYHQQSEASESQDVVEENSVETENSTEVIEPTPEEVAVTVEPEVQEEQPYEGIGKVVVTMEPTPTPEMNDEYILPDSDSRYYAEADIMHLTKEELRIARNEIYARKGRRFQDQSLQAYFESKSWYHGTIDADDFTQDMLNKYEKQNAITISTFEERMNYQ